MPLLLGCLSEKQDGTHSVVISWPSSCWRNGVRRPAQRDGSWTSRGSLPVGRMSQINKAAAHPRWHLLPRRI
ncbi:hypothetical protein AAFF_G00138570 [Aldrovandia affinis]|uniref:Uncharacterized protein n=1 Tax=Aldrovandia affinis TaxID=143900 RepID=A0AAD7TC97_9TELE|nr:hypothetical protein AAFF_G00138570 [Aldrovandia affinis]